MSDEAHTSNRTYRGLPLFENMTPESDESATVIKLSLSADQSATPRDDPRSVILGDMISERETVEHIPATKQQGLSDPRIAPRASLLQPQSSVG